MILKYLSFVWSTEKEAKLGDTVISYVKYTSKSVTVVLADTDKKPYSVVEFLSKPVPEK